MGLVSPCFTAFKKKMAPISDRVNCDLILGWEVERQELLNWACKHGVCCAECDPNYDVDGETPDKKRQRVDASEKGCLCMCDWFRDIGVWTPERLAQIGLKDGVRLIERFNGDVYHVQLLPVDCVWTSGQEVVNVLLDYKKVEAGRNLFKDITGEEPDDGPFVIADASLNE